MIAEDGEPPTREGATRIKLLAPLLSVQRCLLNRIFGSFVLSQD